MPEVFQNVKLLTHTPNPENVAAMAAKLCYSKANIENLQDKIEKKSQINFIQKLINMGHESALEHVTFTFAIEGVSRALLAQLTRHRIASFSVQSQRYVDYEDGFGYVIPPSIEKLGLIHIDRYESQMEQIHKWYNEWKTILGDKGESSNEDARFILPNACETKIIVTMNARELRHFFSLRMCNRAQWEIRELAKEMLRLCLEVAPSLFFDAGPGCIRGHCPEGAKSCGKAAEVRAEHCSRLNQLEGTPNDE